MPEFPPDMKAGEKAADRLRRIGRLPEDIRARALKEGLLAAATSGGHEQATSFAWALLELATVPALKPSGPSWSPMRAWGERRLRVSDTALAGVVGVWVALSDDVKAAARGVGQSRWDGACRAAQQRAPGRSSSRHFVSSAGDADGAGVDRRPARGLPAGSGPRPVQHRRRRCHRRRQDDIAAGAGELHPAVRAADHGRGVLGAGAAGRARDQPRAPAASSAGVDALHLAVGRDHAGARGPRRAPRARRPRSRAGGRTASGSSGSASCGWPSRSACFPSPSSASPRP